MPKHFNLFALLAVFLCVSGLPGSSAEPSWRFSNPQPHGINIFEMGFDGGIVWQVGERGRLYTSADLDVWFPHDAPVQRSLRSITFFKGEAVISGEAGTILHGSSPDHLTLVDLKTADWLEGVAASTNLVVAVGDNGSIYSSPDAVTWTRRGAFTEWLRSVAWGNGTFVAVGENGFLATSADGVAWSKQNIGTTVSLNKVSWLNDRFWVVGESGIVLTNNFRLTFSKINTGVTNTLFAVAANTNEVVLAGDSAVILGSTSGGPWRQQADATSPTLAPLWPYYSALWDGRLFLLGGRTGMQVQGFRTNAAAPLNWYSDDQPTRNWLWAVTRTADFYAAAGAEGTIVTSLDGLDWTREATPTNVQSQVLLGIAGNRSNLVVVGSGGTILWSPNIVTNTLATNSSGQLTNVQTSLFGVLWKQVTPPPVTNDLQAIAATDSLFVAAGSRGTILTSPNGAAWQTRSSGTTAYLSSAAAWPGGFVLAGASGTILTSPNGTTWTKANSGVTNWVYAVRYAGNKLIAVGENGLILTSDDAKQWRSRQSGTTEWINDITFVANNWYAVAGSGLVLRSADSVTWTPLLACTTKSLYSAATDGSQLIAVGLEGVILRSQIAPITSPINFLSYGTRAGNSVFLFDGATDQRFILESKPALSSPWQTETELEIVESGGTLIYETPNASQNAKFFRTRLLTP